MRKLLTCVVVIAFVAMGCERKPGAPYDPDRVENEKHPQSAPSSVPEAGIDALKDMKKISKEEQQKVKDDQQTLNQVDNN